MAQPDLVFRTDSFIEVQRVDLQDLVSCMEAEVYYLGDWASVPRD